MPIQKDLHILLSFYKLSERKKEKKKENAKHASSLPPCDSEQHSIISHD